MAQSWESKAIQKAGQEWQQAKRRNDKAGMARAAAKADRLRKQEGYILKGGTAKSKPVQTSKKYKTQKTGGILGIGAKSANQSYNVYASRLKEEQKSLTGSHGNVYAKQIEKDAARKKKEKDSAAEQARQMAIDPRNPYNIRTGKGKVAARQEKQNTYGAFNRIKNTLSGAGKDYVASTGNAFVTANEATNRFLEKMETPNLTNDQMQDLLARHGAGTTPDALAKMKNPGHKEFDALHESAEKDLERAKQGLGIVGRAAVDIGSGVTQLAGDVLLGGGNALVPMAIRSFGGGASEARKDGASLSQQMVYGLGSAATEVLTEKLTNIAGPLKKVMGRGIGDKAVEDLIDRAAKSISKSAVGELVGKGVLRGAAGMAGEGLEEMISDVVNPVLKDMVYTDGETAKMITPEFWKNTLYDGLIGAGVSGVLSGGGAVINRATGVNNQNGTLDRVPVLGGNGRVAYQKQSLLNASSQSDANPKSEMQNHENSIRLTEGDLERYVRAGNEKATYRKQKIIRQGGSPILTNERQIHSYITDSVQGKARGETRGYGKVNQKLADAVYRFSAGKVDLNGMYLELSSDDIRHSYQNHMTPKQDGDIPLNMKDYLSIPDYVDRFDDVLGVVPTKNGIRIMLGKKINGYSVISEMAIEGSNSVRFKNMWGVSTDKYNASTKRKSRRSLGAGSAIKAPVVTQHSGQAFPNITVQQSKTGVKENSQEVLGQSAQFEPVAVYRNAGTAMPKTVSERERTIIAGIKKRSGLTIQFADLPEGFDGHYENGVITISRHAKNPVLSVLTHELTHAIEVSGLYNKFANRVMEYVGKKGIDVESEMEQIAFNYADNGKLLTPDGVRREFVAKYTEEFLFTDEKSIWLLAREEPNLFRRVYEWLSDTVKRFYGDLSADERFLLDAQRMYERAMKETRKAEAKGVGHGRSGQYSISKDLNEDLERVLKGTFRREQGEVNLGTTSDFLVNVIGAEQLTQSMPAHKAYAAMVSEEQAKRDGRYRSDLNYHSLGKEGLLAVLDAAEDPIAAFVAADDSNTGESRNDRIVLVTDQKDAAGNYILVVAQLDSTGLVDGRRLNVNRTVATYGKDYVTGMITDAIADRRILDIKKVNNPLSEGVQFANRLTVDDFKKNIQRFWDNVKWERMSNKQKQKYLGGQNRFEGTQPFKDLQARLEAKYGSDWAKK